MRFIVTDKFEDFFKYTDEEQTKHDLLFNERSKLLEEIRNANRDTNHEDVRSKNRPRIETITSELKILRKKCIERTHTSWDDDQWLTWMFPGVRLAMDETLFRAKELEIFIKRARLDAVEALRRLTSLGDDEEQVRSSATVEFNSGEVQGISIEGWVNHRVSEWKNERTQLLQLPALTTAYAQGLEAVLSIRESGGESKYTKTFDHGSIRDNKFIFNHGITPTVIARILYHIPSIPCSRYRKIAELIEDLIVLPKDVKFKSVTSIYRTQKSIAANEERRDKEEYKITAAIINQLR